jgi:ABC-type uncharacterized transport system substrate-binding protein
MRRDPADPLPSAGLPRRAFVAAVAGGLLAGPLAARAQRPDRNRRIGILLFTQQDLAVIAACFQELKVLGDVDGKTFALDYRDAEGKYERLPVLAAELVRLGPDVLFSYGGEQAPIVKRATASIPIVVVVSNDPVASGLVASLARPGGNVTGVTYVHDALAGKSIELLKQAAPSVSRVAILWNPNHTIPSSARRSARRTRCESICNRSRCERPVTLTARSRPRSARGLRPSSSRDLAS